MDIYELDKILKSWYHYTTIVQAYPLGEVPQGYKIKQLALYCVPEVRKINFYTTLEVL